MKTIELTEEQAKWLKEHLDSRAVDRHYKGGPRVDADEHADAIRLKLQREIDRERW
jgi:hypothetical protein